ncbi:hypothetical protein LCGC14_1170090 [marine sediment metagenome]|uniref:Pectate lyase superfamily protein domain-containing protein n=1 Tax=marine sediment metagenome TaxID=412755 RepID=A0A0F9MD24_9ZZZZ
MKRFALSASVILLIIAFVAPVYAAGNLFSYPRFEAIDGNGRPLRGAQLFTYEEGTTTDKPTYSDNARTVEHTNPVIMDSNGEATIYLLGAYKMNLKTRSGGQLPGWPIDNIFGTATPFAATVFPDADAADQGATGNSDTVKYHIDTTIGATNKGTIYFRHDSGGEWTDYTFGTAETIPANVTLQFEPGARIAVSTGVTVTVNAPEQIIAAVDLQRFALTGTGVVEFTKMGTVRPEWWGALRDGSTNDTDAFDVAETALSKGGTIALLGGVYRILNWIISQDNLLVEGISPGVHNNIITGGGTTLKSIGGSNTDYVIQIASPTDYKIVLTKFLVDGNGRTTRGILFNGTACRIDSVAFSVNASYSIFTDPDDVDAVDGGGIYNSWIIGPGIQIGGTNLNIRDNYFNGEGTQTTAINIVVGQNINITGNSIESWLRPVINIDNTSASSAVRVVTIQDNEIADGDGGGTITLDVQDMDTLRIVGNFFSSGTSAPDTLIDLVANVGYDVSIHGNWAQRGGVPTVVEFGAGTGKATSYNIHNNGNMLLDIKYSRQSNANMIAAGTTLGWESLIMKKPGGSAPFIVGELKGRMLKTTNATPVIAYSFPTETTSAGYWSADILAFDTETSPLAVNAYRDDSRSITTAVTAGADGATVTDIQTIASEGEAAASVVWQARSGNALDEIVELELTGKAATDFTWIIRSIKFAYIP